MSRRREGPKLMALDDAARLVRDGDIVGIGGMTLYRKPMGFVRALARAGTKDLTLLAFTCAFEAEILAAAGALSTLRTCYFGLEFLGLAPQLRRAAETGAIRIVEETEYTIALGLQAALMCVPYLPSRDCEVGTDYFRIRPDLRRALSLAIDREAISRDIYLGSLPPAHSLTAPDCGGYTAQAAVPDDVVEARALLARAGFPEGRGLPPIDVITHNDSDSQRMMVAIQTRWATELGVHVTLTPLEQKTLFQDQQSLDYSIGQFGWYADYADPYTYLGMFTTGNGNNVTGWSNREYDRLVDATTRTADNGRRFALFQQAEAVLLQSSPVAPITFGGLVHVIQPTVHGWQVNQLGFQHYQDIWLGDH